MKFSKRRKIISIAVLILFGFFSSLFINNISINSALAKQPTQSSLETSIEQNIAFGLEQEGQQFYAQGNYQAAIQQWQKAQQAYQSQGNIILEARVLSNLGLAYYQIGDWQQATLHNEAGYNLLADQEGTEVDQVLAQILNNQGILQLASGTTEQAISSWRKAQELYDDLGDEKGSVRAAINQANAFESLGFYHRALRILSEVATRLENQPDSALKSMGLRNYGDSLRLAGKFTEAQSVLEKNLAIAKRLNLAQERVQTLLALGKLTLVQSNFDHQISKGKALEFYQKALMLCQDTQNCLATDIPLQINLAQFNLLLTTKYWWRADSLIPEIKGDFENIQAFNSRDLIFQQISFAHSSLKLYRKKINSQRQLKNIASLSEIELMLQDAITEAKNTQESRLESYGLGLQGQVKAELQQWQAARDLTNQALKISQIVDAPEISYLWEWQLARIEKKMGNRQKVIAHYDEAIGLLESLSKDLVTIDPYLQYSFRDTVEPVYRQAVDLLITTDNNQPLSQLDLKKALKHIESLQLAELNNFFREDCLDANPVEIDSIDLHAAAIYPIILRDRLEIIVSLPKQPLVHYSTDIEQTQLETVIKQLHDRIVIRSRRNYYQPAEALYDYIIRPIIADLEQNQIETLVFVPDGMLRNIPLGVLYDGEHYLIEDYNVVLNPGLQLLSPRPLTDVALSTLAVGITQERGGFPALDFVDLELAEIQNMIESNTLIDNRFTTDAFTEEIKFSDYPIVHIATHGQFSSSLENTFLLAWDDQIKINQLNLIFHSRTLSKENAIELLVLSACETAAGDKWAALGLAGMAVRAGAKSTLATLWSVNDEATSTLMSQFYQELVTNHKGKSQAIRDAQLSLLHDSPYKHPFYWAPYVLVGNWL
ncbi:MAG: CHAT domain-containing protein [Cyanobacteria bacterium P01_F01_bin.143]